MASLGHIEDDAPNVNIVLYNILISCLGEEGELETAVVLWSSLPNKGPQLYFVKYSTILKGLRKTGTIGRNPWAASRREGEGILS